MNTLKFLNENLQLQLELFFPPPKIIPHIGVQTCWNLQVDNNSKISLDRIKVMFSIFSQLCSFVTDLITFVTTIENN